MKNTKCIQKSFTTKIKYILSGFSMPTISLFKSIENKHDVSKGKDCIENLKIYM